MRRRFRPTSPAALHHPPIFAEKSFKYNHFTEMCCGTEAGSYLRLIDSCITQLKAQRPSTTCIESKQEEKKRNRWGVWPCRWQLVSSHPGGNPGANLKSISHRCHPILVAFVWELTKETIYLPLGCHQGGAAEQWKLQHGARCVCPAGNATDNWGPPPEDGGTLPIP